MDAWLSLLVGDFHSAITVHELGSCVLLFGKHLNQANLYSRTVISGGRNLKTQKEEFGGRTKNMAAYPAGEPRSGHGLIKDTSRFTFGLNLQQAQILFFCC